MCRGDKQPDGSVVFRQIIRVPAPPPDSPSYPDPEQTAVPVPDRIVGVAAYSNLELQQTFLISVTGVVEAEVQRFLQELRVCLAAVPSSTRQDERERPAPGPSHADDVLRAFDTANLGIDIRLDPQQSRERFEAGYDLLFVIDPSIAKNVVHD